MKYEEVYVLTLHSEKDGIVDGQIRTNNTTHMYMLFSTWSFVVCQSINTNLICGCRCGPQLYSKSCTSCVI